MKKIIFKIGALLFCLALFSCQDNITNYLDKPPGIDVTEDTIFSSKKEVESFIAGTYFYGLNSIFPYGTYNNGDPGMPEWLLNPNPSYCTTSPISDESEMGDSWYSSQQWNSASINPTYIVYQEDERWFLRWRAIRNANILIERIPTVTTVDDTYKKQINGEARFIRALNNFELFKRYGGMPIVSKRLGGSDNLLQMTRKPLVEFVKFIVSDCDTAILNLPATYPSNQRGRANSLAARALKAKALLFAASPLFNTDTPYLNNSTTNLLVTYGNYDKQRWAAAANAAKEVIDNAPASGCNLITNQGTDKNYKYAWEVNDNAEIILAEKGTGPINVYYDPWRQLLPVGFSISIGCWSMPCVTHNFVMLYDKKDGTKQTWDLVNGGDNLSQKYSELDNRFKQTIAYNGSYWNSVITNVETFEGGKHISMNKTGAFMHKLIPDLFVGGNEKANPNDILFRLAEAYLSYAEALNEFNDAPPAEAYNAVNTIRSRSGMPDVTGLSKDQFREMIHKERAIELAFEDHRLWDIRRWMIAENDGVMKGNMYGVKITKITGSTEFHYQPFVFESRFFNRNMYLHPLPQKEVNKGYLIQNPGW